MMTRIAIPALLVLSVATLATDPPKPVKVFILAGQSNMEGHAVVDLTGKDYNDGKGTLNALLGDPGKSELSVVRASPSRTLRWPGDCSVGNEAQP